ncbi:MAG TPA: alpha-L-fucosidase [Pyrinomonadaceae bacterium]|nr:alpha-L-fucosidase [Pyrinomonadaceae bacterium]
MHRKKLVLLSILALSTAFDLSASDQSQLVKKLQYGSSAPYVVQPGQGEVRRAAFTEAEQNRRLKWWREARFGMFIHWGLYAVPAGEWKGQLIPGIGEWIMNRAKIPVNEYEQLAPQFNPVGFNAEQWVKLAKDAGMKYIVITAKHHDGFAMYDSKTSPYNIVAATPFKRDPLKELAMAAQKADIKLCFYYSQTQDWHDPDAVGNDWDFPDESKKNFSRYFEEKVKPQVRELLTNYGPIGLIWFDTPRNITREQSEELVRLVHQLQPDCLVSGRVGHGVGDYDSVGDNQISVGEVRRDWETPVTLNDTWGFKKDDENWKPTAILIRQMVQVVSRGGNYLLNVGPTARGIIPEPSVQRLQQVGEWLKKNSEAVYGNGPGPFPYELPWGLITTRPGKLYLHVFDWPGKELQVYGLKGKVQKAYFLTNRSQLKFTQKTEPKLDHHTLTIHLPANAPDQYDSVIVLEVDGETAADTALMQQPDESVTLPAFLANAHKAAGESGLRFDSRGVVERWLNKEEWLDWNFKVTRPGAFKVIVLTSEQKYGRDWEGGHKLQIEVAGQKLSAVVDNNGKEENPANPYWKYVISEMGTVKIDGPGSYRLSLKPETIRSEKQLGITLVSVKLITDTRQ